MSSISKMSDECKKCPHINDCDNKRMVACAMIEWKPNATASIMMPLTQPMYSVDHSVTINMGEYGNINTFLEDITEQIKKELYKNLNCSLKSKGDYNVLKRRL